MRGLQQMATIRRNKYGRLMYAATITGTLVTGWAPEAERAAVLTDEAARDVVDGYKGRGGDRTGQIAALDAKGKVLAAWGEPGEPPVAPKPVASLPDLAAKVDLLEERVEMIEKCGDGLTADEVSSLKGMLGEWAAHKKSEAAKDKMKDKEQQARGEHKSPVAPVG